MLRHVRAWPQHRATHQTHHKDHTATIHNDPPRWYTFTHIVPRIALEWLWYKSPKSAKTLDTIALCDIMAPVRRETGLFKRVKWPTIELDAQERSMFALYENHTTYAVISHLLDLIKQHKTASGYLRDGSSVKSILRDDIDIAIEELSERHYAGKVTEKQNQIIIDSTKYLFQ